MFLGEMPEKQLYFSDPVGSGKRARSPLQRPKGTGIPTPRHVHRAACSPSRPCCWKRASPCSLSPPHLQIWTLGVLSWKLFCDIHSVGASLCPDSYEFQDETSQKLAFEWRLFLSRSHAPSWLRKEWGAAPGNVSFAQLLWRAAPRGSGEPFGVSQCNVIPSTCSCLPGVKQQPLTNPAVIRESSLSAGIRWLANSEPSWLFRLHVRAFPGRANLLCLSAPFRPGSTSSLVRRSRQ